MSKLEELIRELCPDGVEYKKLEDTLRIKNGKDYKHLSSGTIPVYGSGGIMTYVDQYCFDKPSVLIPRKGSLDKLYYVDKPFWNVDTIFYTDINQNILLPKYLYYCLEGKHLERLNKAGGVPSLTQSVLNGVCIPVPPLPVQEEIVRILDAFTELNTNLSNELTSELEARKKQFEYYRSQLLTNHNPPTYKAVGDLCNVVTGGEPPADCIKNSSPDDKHPYAVWGNGKEIYGYSSTYKIDQDSVVISSIGANTGTVYFRSAFFTPIIRLKVLIPKAADINVRYLYHALSAAKIESKSSSVPNMNATEIKRIKLPVPTLTEQERIVSILDCFDILCSDLTSGLPVEILSRKKQYEYYRDKLLTFKEKTN